MPLKANQTVISHTLQRENITKARADLKETRQDYRKKLVEEETKIKDSLNDPFNTFYGNISVAEEREFRLRLNAHQTYVLTPEMIMKEAILKDSTALFDEHRPMLKKEHRTLILEAVHRYYHLRVLLSMCEEALEQLEKVEKTPGNAQQEQKLLEILGYHFLYAPEKFPEIAYMQLKTGKLPRKEQVENYIWACEGFEKNENRLFQLMAGGGKTSYIARFLFCGPNGISIPPSF